MEFKSSKCICLVFLLLLKIGRINSQVPVYADTSHTDSIKTAIHDLFTELDHAGFGKFSIRPLKEFSSTGFVFLLANTTSAIRTPDELKKYGPEGIYINANDQSAIIAGNSALALQEAIYIYLEQLGFRFLMPGEIWKVVPKINSPFKKISILTKPDFEFRSIANGHGFYTRKNIEKEFYSWYKANRMGGAFSVWVGHEYDDIVQRNTAFFKEHPEYFAQPVTKGNLPAGPKFDVSKKELVQFIIDDALKRIETMKKNGENPLLISMEPSDGGGFCTKPECLKIGGPVEQTFYLSNAVAKEVRAKYPGTWVGSLAYSEHILPPSFKMEPNTFVMVTTGFNNSGLSTEQLLQEWKKKGSKTGIYDYISVYEWDNDLPGQVTAAQSGTLQKAIQNYYNAGARVYNAESTMGWISKGPGQYILSKILWDKNADVSAIKNDFFEKGFGNVAPVIRKLYDDWAFYPHRIFMSNDLANWLAWTDEAYKKSESPIIKKRIEQIKIYLHYLVMYRNFKINPTEANMISLLTFAYRNFDTGAFAIFPALISLANYNGFPKLAFYNSPKQPYITDQGPSSSAELEALFRDDILQTKRTPEVERYKKTDSFIKLSSIVPAINNGIEITRHAYWEKTEFVIKINKKDTGNYFDILSNHAQVSDARNVSIDIFPVMLDAEINETAKPIIHYEQKKNMTREKYSLKSLAPGFYTVKVDDHRKMFDLEFSKNIDYSVVMNSRNKLLTTSAAGLNNFFFFVPKGTKNLRISKTVVLRIYTPTKRELNFENNKEEVLDIQVQPGEEGIWAVFFQAGSLLIEGVPPYLGTNPSRMLLPAYLKK